MEDYGRKMSETMRIVFVLFTILVQQVLFAQDVEDNRVPVCGYYYEIYDKKEITDYYVNQYKRFTREETYSTTIDVSHKNHIIISEIAGRELFKRNQKNHYGTDFLKYALIRFIYIQNNPKHIFINNVAWSWCI